MAHLWFRDENEEEDIWSAMPLNGHAVDISVCPPRVLTEGFRLGVDATAAVLCAQSGDAPAWVLLAGTDGGVRINGFAPVAGVRVLQDRDEVRVASANPVFFSTETLPSVQEFAAGDRELFCGRCRRPMENARTAVRCPRCSIWYHQESDRPCWTYAPACGFCPQPTTLDARYGWTPEA